MEMKMENSLYEILGKAAVSFGVGSVVGSVIDNMCTVSPTGTLAKVGFTVGKLALKSYAGSQVGEWAVNETKKTIENVKKFGLIGALYE